MEKLQPLILLLNPSYHVNKYVLKLKSQPQDIFLRNILGKLNLNCTISHFLTFKRYLFALLTCPYFSYVIDKNFKSHILKRKIIVSFLKGAFDYFECLSVE